MKKYNIYHYDYKFDCGYFDREYVDTIYLASNEKMKYGIKHATIDHDLYNILDECSNDVWELNSEHAYDYYQIVLQENINEHYTII